jgi:diaminohydroxyphosphoribosylaminopyrimidine deaminase / 5-amino-6-(5-phosphoribosylamino)uracil reductase
MRDLAFLILPACPSSCHHGYVVRNGQCSARKSAPLTNTISQRSGLNMSNSTNKPAGSLVHAGNDAALMRRCVELAKRAEGQTRPNPIVGCVLVDAVGNIISEGFHPRAGQMHAEAVALAEAEKNGISVAGATAYVSLEPCNHTGRTPPCAAALVRAKVARVVVGMVDPDPRTSGGGVKTLRDAGIQVTVGVEESLCRTANEAFVHRIEHRRPFGILKYAMTLDGKIATESGSSQWVTGESSREFVHSLRSGVDAIIVGGQTLRMDDSRLTVRSSSNRLSSSNSLVGQEEKTSLSPLRVVMTKSLDLPLQARMWDDAKRLRTVVLTSRGHGRPDMVRHLIDKDVEVQEFPSLSPLDAMRFLYDQDALSVLWECGGRLAASAVADGAIQKVHAFIAPKLVGGGPSTPCPMSSPPLANFMCDALLLRARTVEHYGDDFLVTGYL